MKCKKARTCQGKSKIAQMAYNEKLADRVRELIALTHKNIEEKKMFGGLCFMVNGKMCVGVEKDRMMVRFDPARNDEIMELSGAGPMDFTKRVMKGFAFVEADVLKSKKELEFWIGLALEFNERAKAARARVQKPGRNLRA